jgi:trigger factor
MCGPTRGARYTHAPVKATVEPLEGNKVKLSVEVDEAEVDEAVNAAFRRIAREVRIPGFRPGKAPRRLLEARMGSGVAREEALREALPEYYSRAVRENDVDVIAAPAIEITDGEESGPVLFDAVVEIRPRVAVPGYGNLRVTLNRPEATEEEIDAQVDRLRDQLGELRTVDRPAAGGDHVSINIHGSRDGEPVPGLTADDYLYEVGSASIVPDLDEQLRGAKVGDVLEFDATPPGTDQPAVHFRVLLKEVKEKVLPDIDDDWANEASEFDTVEELRADLAARITNVRRVQAQMQLRERTAEALIGLVEDDAPEPLVASEVQQRLQELVLRLSTQGVTPEQYLQSTGRTQEQLVEEARGPAVQAVKADLALRSVADAENIECTDDDLDEELRRVAERLNQKVDRVRREFERVGTLPEVRSDVRKRKALDWLIERVEIVDQNGQPIDRALLELPDDGAAELAPSDQPEDAEDVE